MSSPVPSAQVMDLLTRFLNVNLSTRNLKLSKKDTDGRVNSSINEKEIRASIKTAASCNEQFTDQLGLSITDPADRDWVDFTVEGNGTFVPVNIKVTTMDGAADNLSCKLGMYYALTGIRPDFSNSISWGGYTERLAAGLSTTGGNRDADYFFLVVNKRVPGDVFWTSLKRIKALSPNGNNLPFQADWAKNRDQILREPTDAVKYILGIFHQSVVLRAKLKEQFESNLKDYY